MATAVTVMPTSLPYDGNAIEIGTETFILPPLNIRGLKANQKAQRELAGLDEKDPGWFDKIFDLMLPVLLIALNRNYPDLKLEHLEENLSKEQYVVALRTMREVSGLVVPENPTEPATTPATTSQPITTGSSFTSSSKPDGPGSTSSEK